MPFTLALTSLHQPPINGIPPFPPSYLCISPPLQVSGTLVAQSGCVLAALDEHVGARGFMMPLDLGEGGRCRGGAAKGGEGTPGSGGGGGMARESASWDTAQVLRSPVQHLLCSSARTRPTFCALYPPCSTNP